MSVQRTSQYASAYSLAHWLKLCKTSGSCLTPSSAFLLALSPTSLSCADDGSPTPPSHPSPRSAPSLKVLVYTQSREVREEEQARLASAPHLPYSVILTTYEVVLKDAHFLRK